MHNFKFNALAAATLAITSATAFAQTHQHSASCGHDELNSPAIQHIGQSRLNAAVVKSAAPFTDGAVRTMNFSATTDSMIDVIVYVHPSYIDDLSSPIRFDENNKPIENGAQFMHDRVQEQFDKVNSAFEINNINARYRIAYIHLLDVNLPAAGDSDAFGDEFGDIATCILAENLDDTIEACKEPVYADAVTQFANSGADTFQYLRSDKGHGVLGYGFFFGGSSYYDTYVGTMTDLVSSESDIENINAYLAEYGAVTIHEVGHVLGANHHDEDFDGTGHQGHYCGEPFPGASIKKATVMSPIISNTHLFYSDPKIEVQGDVCGIAGVADNSDAVRTNAPLLAAVADKPVVSANFEFTQDSMVVDSGSGKHTLRLQRLGDLSQPVSVNLMAVDNTAWELRDFEFGWQEVSFAAGQAYADVEFTALEREGKHPNTQFAVKMMYATAGNLSTEQMQINIQSTNLPMIGSVSLAQSTYTVMENAGTVTLTISRTNGVDGEAVLSVKTRNQTAIAGTDYTAVDTQLTLADGQESATVMVNIINNSTYQGSRTFALDIVPTTEGLTAGTTTATITITDDEVPPSTGGGSGGTGGGSDTGESSGGSLSFITALFGVMLLMRRKFTNQFHNERK